MPKRTFHCDSPGCHNTIVVDSIDALLEAGWIVFHEHRGLAVLICAECLYEDAQEEGESPGG